MLLLCRCRSQPGPSSEETPAASRPAVHSPTSVTLQQKGLDDRSLPPTPDVRLYHRAVVVAQEATGEHACSGAVVILGGGIVAWSSACRSSRAVCLHHMVL